MKKTTLDPIEFDYMDIFKISSIVLHRRQKLIQVWNDIRLTKFDSIFVFEWTIPQQSSREAKVAASLWKCICKCLSLALL